MALHPITFARGLNGPQTDGELEIFGQGKKPIDLSRIAIGNRIAIIIP